MIEEQRRKSWGGSIHVLQALKHAVAHEKVGFGWVKSKGVNSLHAGGTVNANDLAVDPLTILGGEEADNTGNVDGLTNTLHGRPGLGVLVNLVVGEVGTAGNVLAADGVVHVGLDTTGGNSVDSDALVTGIDGHAADKGLDGTLGTGVDGVLGDTLGLTGDGAHQDDAATDGKVLVCLTGDEELTTGVDLEDAVELLLGDILEVTEGNDTRVGADNVELTEVLNSLVEELDGLGDITNVGLDGNSVGTILLDLLDNLVGSLGRVGVVDNNLSTTLSELNGHRLANTTAGASDKGDLSVKARRLNSRHCDCCLVVGLVEGGKW